MNLYDLKNQYLDFLNFVTDPDNESIDKQVIADTLEALDGVLDDKLINTARVISSIELEAEAIEAVELRLRNRRQALENKAGWLRSYVIENMQATGHTRIEMADISMKLAKLPASVQVIDESKIPAEFWKETVTRAISKADIKSAGGCPGTVIESKGYRVSIK
jgi:SpoVK/Ycf46/Vps4 family AAA+-type ATPase